jgi:hypothetical protein
LKLDLGLRRPRIPEVVSQGILNNFQISLAYNSGGAKKSESDGPNQITVRLDGRKN